ncbi:MAG: hypothetical protein ABSE04_01815 [Candidatus Microgenomates bacterium]|jgi:hypothetical protein
MDEVKEENKEISPKSSNSTLYLVFVIILLVVAGGAFYFGRKSGEAKMTAFYQSQPKPSGMGIPRPSGPPNFKGQKLSDVQMLSSATLIYPGVSNTDVNRTLINWTLSTTQNSDGTVTVKLTPAEPEATEGDTTQTFTVKPGDKLYFDDLNPNDDQPGMDVNTHDDLGILVDSNGIIQ